MTSTLTMLDQDDVGLAPYAPVELLRRWREAGDVCAFEAVCLTIDLAGSTRLTDRFAGAGPNGAEQLGDILSGYFAAITEAIIAHGGVIARIAGDAVTALWPTRTSTAAAAFAAREAALAALPVGGDGPEPLAHRIAIDIGVVDLLVLGDPGERRFILASGQPLRALAPGRLRGEPGEIVMADRIHQLLATDAGAPRADLKATDIVERLEDFVPPLVASHVRAGLRDWMAEFRWISVVYVGLTPTGGGSDIRDTFEIIHAIARRAGAAIWDVVDEDKGVVFKIIFGLPPYATEADAVGALDVARHIHQTAREAGRSLSVGVATGRAFFGEVGGARRREHIGVGPVMNYGARLMQAADEAVLCDDATARAADGLFRMDAPFELSVKGREAPLPAHRLLGLGDPHWSGHRDDAGEAPAGRQAECALIDERIDAVLAGHAESLWLEGELGAGKTRLLRYAGARARALGLKVVMAGGLPSEQITPFHVVRRLLSGLVGTAGEPAPDATTTLQRLRALLDDGMEAGNDPLLEDILPRPGRDRPTGRMTGRTRRDALSRLVTRIVDRATEVAPCVLLVDDLHWVDSASALLLADVVKRCPRVVAIMAARPRSAGVHEEERGDNSPLADSATWRVLSRLDRAATIDMVRARLGADRLSGRLADFILDRTQGLPLHAEQLALSLLERRAVQVVAGRCELAAGALSDDAASRGLAALITARLDRLDPMALRVAKTASIIGLEFELGRLARVDPGAFDRTEIDSAVRRLAAADFIRPMGAGRYAFQHAVMREACYALMPFRQRGPLQAVLARALEVEGSIANAAELAWRWEEAGAFARAINHRADAAATSLRVHAVAEALDHAAHMERLAGLSLRPLTREQRVRLERIRADALQEQARFAEAALHYRICADLAGLSAPRTRGALFVGLVQEGVRHLAYRAGLRRRPLDASRDRLAAHIHMRLAEHAYFFNDTLAVMHGTLTSLNRAQRCESATEMTLGFAGLAVSFGVAGLHGSAADYARRAVASAERHGELHDRGLAHLMAAVATFPSGDWTGTAAHAAHGARAFEIAGDAFRRQTCVVLGAYAHLAQGATAEARQALTDLAPAAEDADAAALRAWTAAGLGVLDILAGAPPGPAIAAIAASLAEPLSHADRLVCLGPLIRLKLMAGDEAGARVSALEAMDILRRGAPTAGIGFISVPRIAEAWIDLGDAAHAEAALRASRAFSRTVRIARPLNSYAIGRLAMRQGKAAAARDAWRRGLADAEAMGMPLEACLCREALAAH